MFGNQIKHFRMFDTGVLKPLIILGEIQSKSSPNFMIIKIIFHLFIFHSLECVIDPYHSAAMLSLRGIKSLVFAWKPQPDRNSVQGLPCKNKTFYSPETQHGHRVRSVYTL